MNTYTKSITAQLFHRWKFAISWKEKLNWDAFVSVFLFNFSKLNVSNKVEVSIGYLYLEKKKISSFRCFTLKLIRKYMRQNPMIDELEELWQKLFQCTFTTFYFSWDSHQEWKMASTINFQRVKKNIFTMWNIMEDKNVLKVKILERVEKDI